jgi:glucosylceramidase
LKLLRATSAVPARRHHRVVPGVASLVVLAAIVALPTRTAADAYAVDRYAVSVYQTNANLSDALTQLAATHFEHTPPAGGEPVIAINDRTDYQRIEGFGAAMTDSSAWLIEREISPPTRTTVMEDLFGTGGIDLSFVRVPIGSSDYTAGGQPYSYDDLPPGKSDPRLRHFSISHDEVYILPALRQARSIDPATEFFASPWSPPGWMKGNDALNNLGEQGTLLGSAYGPWAAYVIKFLQDYAEEGISISALTAANEPSNPTNYPGMNISAASESAWISQDLVPALDRAKLKVKVYADDQGWSRSSVQFAQQSITGAAAKDLAGIAWHCYYGSPNVMSSFRALRPGLDEIVDECSPGISAIPTSEVVISSLRNWASAVALWNIALDQSGGPVQEPNTGCPNCTGLVTINEKTHRAQPTLSYYQLGQASKFVARGARRVPSTNFVTYDYSKPGVNFISPGLDDVVFVNPNGTRVLLVYNNSPSTIPFAVDWHGVYFDYTEPAHAMTTFEWNITSPQ